MTLAAPVHPQLVLALDMAPATSFETFHGDGEATLASRTVAAFARGEIDERQLFLWGETGSGKSHLLAAACQTVSELGYRIAYLPGELANQRGALEGLESCDLVCVDDLQRLDHGSEHALFHCINRCREADTRLLFAADRAIEKLGLALPDLATRLAWGPVFHLEPLQDLALVDALREEFAARSLEASDEVLAHLVAHYPRDMTSLKTLVDALDAASLSEQHRLTVPFVRRVVAQMSGIFGGEGV